MRADTVATAVGAVRWVVALTLTVMLALVPSGAAQDAVRSTVGETVPVPALPFPGNADPSQCGIPQAVGDNVTAVLDGHYRGTLVEPTVYLYDSHARTAVTGEAPSGTLVQVLFFQSNPTLDYYMVRIVTGNGTVEGWVPAPFVRDVTTH